MSKEQDLPPREPKEAARLINARFLPNHPIVAEVRRMVQKTARENAVTLEKLQAISDAVGAPTPHVGTAASDTDPNGDVVVEWWCEPRKVTIYLGEDSEILWSERIVRSDGRTDVCGAPSTLKNAEGALRWLVTGNESTLPTPE